MTGTPATVEAQTNGRSGRFGRTARRVGGAAALAAVMGSGLSVVAAPSASALTSIGYCFVTTDGRPAAGVNTELYAYTPYGNYRIGTGRTGSSGCDVVDTSAYSNYYIAVSAGSFMDRGVRYVGWAPKWAGPGYGHAYVGTGVASLRW